VVVDAAAGLLGAQAPVDQPFVVPGGLHGGIRRAGHLVQDVGGAEGDDTGLGGVLAVGVGLGQHLRPVVGHIVEQDQGRDQGALVGEVAMRPLAQIAAVADEPQGRS
jgi:hypothetical protein